MLQAKNSIEDSDLFEEEVVEVNPSDNIIMGDCIQGMQNISQNSYDVAVVDPPYNLSKGGNWSWEGGGSLPGLGGAWGKTMAKWDDMPLSSYLDFTLSWLIAVKKLVKPTGSIWVHGTYHNIGMVNFAMQMLEIEIINEVVWYKRNSFPNLSGRRLTASHETILWAHTGDAKSRDYLFNYQQAKNMNCPEDMMKSTGKQMRTVWDIPNNKEKRELAFGKHPTQKPIRLIKRMLSLSTKPGDKILVPFVGSGTECVVAKEFGLGFLGFEIDPEYIDLANRRLAATRPKLSVKQGNLEHEM